jgi:4-hydroxy-tetrahydrodipicolinate reductase
MVEEPMKPITVVVHGALGKVGRELITGVSRDPGLSLIGAVDVQAAKNHIEIPETLEKVPLFANLDEMLEKEYPGVMIDFSIAEASIGAIRTAAKRGIDLVVGTTGFSDEERAEIGTLAKDNNVGIVLAPNFALGAIVLVHLAQIAAKYFDYAEIIELHHEQKADAPSGTALATAQAMLQSRGKPFNYPVTRNEKLKGSRGGQIEGITVHSARLPGFVASQEVLFGGQGQRLSIRHDAINRECYVPGVLLAVKEVIQCKGKITDLTDLLHFGGL